MSEGDDDDDGDDGDGSGGSTLKPSFVLAGPSTVPSSSSEEDDAAFGAGGASPFSFFFFCFNVMVGIVAASVACSVAGAAAVAPRRAPCSGREDRRRECVVAFLFADATPLLLLLLSLFIGNWSERTRETKVGRQRRDAGCCLVDPTDRPTGDLVSLAGSLARSFARLVVLLFPSNVLSCCLWDE